MFFAAEPTLWRGVEQAVAAEIVRLGIGRGGAVRIAGTDEAEFVRVVAARVLHRQAILVRLADVAPAKPRRPINAAQQVLQNFVSGELVGG